MASGPVPVFFSNDPERSLEELKRDPAFSFQCLQALVARLLVRNELTREQALAYLADPSEGDSRRGLKRSWKTAEGGSSKATSAEKGDKKMHKKWCDMRGLGVCVNICVYM